MNSFFKDVIAHLLKNAFEGHTKFSVADNTAVGANPIRSISLDAVPVNNDTLISLAWDGGEKLFEKTLSEQEASHQFDLISTDLAEVAALTKQGEYNAAKDLMKKLGQKYAENTGDIVETNLPKLHNTQASADKGNEWPLCSVEGCNNKSDSVDEGGKRYCYTHSWGVGKKLKEASQEDSRLWKQAKITMQNLWFSTTDELLEYQEKQKGAAKPGTDQDHIPLWDKMNKGKAPVAKDELAPASLSYEDVENQKEKEHDDMQKHIDEKIKTELESALQEKAASVFGPDQVELVQVLRKNGRNWDEIKKILIKDFNFDKDATTIFVDEQRQGSDPTGIEVEPVKEEPKTPLTPPEDLVSPETHDKLLQDHEDKKKIDSPIKDDKEPGFSPKEIMDIPEDKEIEDKSSLNNEIARADNDDIHKVAAPTDLNPLQEPIQEKPTTPSQDVVPMGKPLDHNAPQKGDRVFVSSDLTDEKAGFEAVFVSTYKSKGIDFSIVETDDGDLLDIESHRVVKTSEGSGAQDTEPVMEPEIATTKDESIQVTPKMDDFHTSSQDPLLAIKLEAEALLKEVNDMSKTSYVFIRKGLEKHADDSAFEGNGWCRVWVQEDEVSSDSRYPEILKLPDENARIAALKEVARELAHEALRLADSAGAKVGVQSWFDSLKPSDHDRIDWVKLANPKTVEQEEAEEMADFNKDMGYDDSEGPVQLPKMPRSSLEPKVEKESAGVEDVMRGQAGNRGIGKVWIKDSYDGSTVTMSSHFGSKEEFDKWAASKVAGSTTKEIVKSEFPVAAAKKASDFEKGISQNKTSDETLPATTPAKSKNPSLKDKDIDPYKHHSDLEWEEGDPCKLCKSPIDDSCQCTNDKCEFHRMGQSFSATKPEGSEPDQVDLIMAYEDGSLDEAGILKLFSELIKSGQAWSLQGSYGRTAKALIEAGYINEKGTITKDVVDTELAPEQKMLESKYSFKNMKTAADPELDPKTRFKELKITPKYVEKEKATPASPELDQVLSKLNALEQNIAVLETAKKEIMAKAKEEIAKLEESGERVRLDKEWQEAVEQSAALIGALESKIVSWRDKLYTLKTEEVSYVPQLTPTEMLEKLYKKFEGAEKYVQDVLNGMLALAKNVMVNTLVRWPNKKSELSKEASSLDELKRLNEELLAALKELA